MRIPAIRNHLRMLLLIRKNIDWYLERSSGFYKGKIRIHTGSCVLELTKLELDHHINRTKLNLKKSQEIYARRIYAI